MGVPRPAAMCLSVVVSALEEEVALAATLERVRTAPVHELIVVDGRSRDRTREIATRYTDRVLVSERGRARQMNAGAAAASGDILLFLHADTLLPVGFDTAIIRTIGDPGAVGGRFDVTLDGTKRGLGFLGWTINLRSRLTRIATGDQAIFVRKDIFESLGGFPLMPLLEDVAFTAALKRVGRIACLRERVRTSARRWERRGVLRTVALMWSLRLAYALGVPSETLQRLYADVR